MPGAIAITIVLLMFPTVIAISGGVAAGVIGHLLQRDGEIRHDGSELLDIDD